MRTLAIITFIAVIVSAGAAQAAPWCAYYGFQDGATNCGFFSYQQCMAALAGNGGFCAPNRFENSNSSGTDARQRSRRAN
jgi:Protein of unknown function (DUF3551)